MLLSTINALTLHCIALHCNNMPDHRHILRFKSEFAFVCKQTLQHNVIVASGTKIRYLIAKLGFVVSVYVQFHVHPA